MTYNFSAVGGPMWVKFHILVHNDMPTVVMVESKPEVEIQYVGRLFLNRK